MKTHDFTQAKVFLIGLSLLFIGLVGHSQGDWSNFRGAGWDWETTVPSGETPITDGSQVRQIFESEARIGVGANTGGLNEYTAGAASPVHYNGNVYLWYFRPNGDTLRLLNNKQRKYPDMLDENGWGEAGWDIDDYYPTADDIIICVDGETGETKWKKVFPKVGINLPGHKTTINNQTMVAANGKVYAVGSSYWLYCFDAKTGKVEWKSKEHPSFGWIHNVRREAIDKAKIAPFEGGTSREFNGALMFVDGTLLVPTGRKPYKYAAFDPSDGSLLWTSDAFNGSNATPAVWDNNGKKYLIGQNGSTMSCVDIDDGSIVWSKGGLGDAKHPVYLKNDYVFTPLETSDGEGSGEGYIGCYKLADTGASFQWQAPVNVYSIANNTGFFVKQDTVYARMDYDLYMYNLATGDSLGKIEVSTDDGFDDQAYMVKVNNIIFSNRDASHSACVFDVIDTKTDQVVGEWGVYNTTVGYSSPLIAGITDSLMTFRTRTNRIIGYDITQPTGAVRVDIDQSQTVVVEGQTATISATASSSAGSISKVEFYDDSGNKLGEASSSPYEIELDKSQGTYPIRAKAIDGAGNSKMSHSALLTVKKWEVNLRPDTLHLTYGDKFRLYPHTICSKWNELLPPQFQIQNSNEGVNSGVTLQWALVEGGYIDYPDGKPEKFVYIADSAGKHRLVSGVTINGETKYDTSYIFVRKLNQDVTLDSIPDKEVSDPDFTVSASSSWGFPVDLSIASGPATISGSTISLDGNTGYVVLEAYQAGNDTVESVTLQEKFRVKDPAKDSQSISFDSTYLKHVNDPSFELSATASSGLPVNFDLIKGPAYLSGNTITLTGETGNVIIEASQSGDASYNPAPSKEMIIPVLPMGIVWKEDFTDLPDGTDTDSGATAWTTDRYSDQYGTEYFNVSNEEFYTYENYDASIWTSEMIDLSNVDKVNFSVDVWAPGGGYEEADYVKVFYKVDGGPEELLAHKKGLFPLTTVTSGVMKADSLQIIIKAEQSGTGETYYFDNVTVYDKSDSKLSQSITFDPIADKKVDADPFDVHANASSGLPVSFSIVDGPASISDSTVTLDGTEGTVTVKATQSGNDTYQAAVPKERSFEVTLVTENKTTSAVEDRNVIYPNPTNGVVKVKMNNVPVSNGQIEVYTMLGEKVLSREWAGQTVVEIDLSNEPDGIYFIKIGNAVTKVIKK